MTEDSVSELDCRGLVCPEPVLRLRQAVAALPSGGLLRMLATDPATEVDVRAWTRRMGHRVVSVELRDDLFVFIIQKS
jgi:tRNA 2-thiouridine synthesizing protein A